MAKRNLRHRAACPFELSMDLLSGKWKGMIIFRLKNRALRFSELKATLPDISNRMLTLALRELVEDGLLVKRGRSMVKSEMEYALSDIGQKLVQVFVDLSLWGCEYQSYLNLRGVR